MDSAGIWLCALIGVALAGTFAWWHWTSVRTDRARRRVFAKFPSVATTLGFLPQGHSQPGGDVDAATKTPLPGTNGTHRSSEVNGHTGNGVVATRVAPQSAHGAVRSGVPAQGETARGRHPTLSTAP